MNPNFKGSFRTLWFLRGCKGLFLISMLSAAVIALADMVIPQIVRAAIDNAILGGEPNFPKPVLALVNAVGGFSYLGRHLWIMALAILATAVVRSAFQYLFQVGNTKACERMVKTIRDALFSHIERLPFSWHTRIQAGEIIQRCTSDIETVKTFVSEQMTSVFRILMLLLMSTIFMLSMNWRLAVIALIPFPIIIAHSLLFHVKIQKGFTLCDENEGLLSTMAQENLTGVRVVRAFGRERREQERFQAQNEKYTGLWMSLAKTMSFFWSISDALANLQIMLVIVFGAVFCIYGNLTVGMFLAFLSYNAMLTGPIRQLGRMISELSKARVSMGRINQIMRAEEEPLDVVGIRPPMDVVIVFDHVRLAHGDSEELLHDISFSMKGGSTLGILGSTGSGKSTLVMLLDRIYELPRDCGTIRIGGTDIRDIPLEYLRRNIGLVLQEPYLFSRTMAENIGIARQEISPEEIQQAARAACLDETIQHFARGYDTFVGERGVTLSGGQKQRAAIARMLTQQTPVLILDDSLSAVDTKTDTKIRAALQKYFADTSVILISHRIATLSRADWILVLDQGHIIEQGTPDQLRCAGGVYSRIFSLQSRLDEEGGA